jgi:Acyl-CoA reductase (LuxC)
MNFQHRVNAFVKLGSFLLKISNESHPKFQEAYHHNNWFTPENIQQAIASWASQLTQNNLMQWLSPYNIKSNEPKNIAIIMAGNIPLVGFHDLICVLISGNKATVKFSDDDKILPKFLIQELIKIEPEFESYIHISEGRLPKDFDAVIATGSNNTFRYFEYYFRNKSSLLRKNRSSVAVLTGHETTDEMGKLGNDIFSYFGLGCRNVSKIYVPTDYDLATFFEGIESWNSITQHHKYANNYHYHKSIFLLNLAPHLDNNFVIMKEDQSISSPLGVLFFERYESLPQVFELLKQHQNEIQCIVGNTKGENSVAFGDAQSPSLWDYADGEDTLKFLLNL